VKIIAARRGESFFPPRPQKQNRDQTASVKCKAARAQNRVVQAGTKTAAMEQSGEPRFPAVETTAARRQASRRNIRRRRKNTTIRRCHFAECEPIPEFSASRRGFDAGSVARRFVSSRRFLSSLHDAVCARRPYILTDAVLIRFCFCGRGGKKTRHVAPQLFSRRCSLRRRRGFMARGICSCCRRGNLARGILAVRPFATAAAGLREVFSAARSPAIRGNFCSIRAAYVRRVRKHCRQQPA